MSFLEVKGLTARLKGMDHRLLRGVSLQVAAGEVRGLVGESGAGKSMIGKAVLGILPKAVEITGGRSALTASTCWRCRRRTGARGSAPPAR